MRRFIVGALVGSLVACTGRLPRPTYVSQPTSALSVVGYPPPPARVEFIPKQPASRAVWIDGEWQWEGRRWSWRIGRWVIPPDDANFAPWAMVRDADGTVYFASGAWRDARGNEIAEPTPLALGSPTISGVVDPEDEIEKTGTSVRPSSEVDGGEPAADAAIDANPADAGAHAETATP